MAVPLDYRGKVFGHLLKSWLACALGLWLVGAVLLDYRMVKDFSFLHDECLIAAIAAGVGIAFCFGGAMHYVDLALAPAPDGTRIAWWWRVMLVIQKRLFFFAQIAAAAMIVGVLGLMVFGEPIPGSMTAAIQDAQSFGR